MIITYLIWLLLRAEERCAGLGYSWLPHVKLQISVWIHGAAVWIRSSLRCLQLSGGLLASLDSNLTEAHQLRQTRVLLLQGTFDLLKLLLVAKSFLGELGMDDFICLTHLN